MNTLPRSIAVIEQGLADGTHIGAQLYVSQHGTALADLAFGQAIAGVEMTPDTLMLWLSSSKPVTAVAVGQLWERGQLQLDDPVARHIPEFAQNGKESVTVRHLLTHTAGLRPAAENFTPMPWDQVIAHICAAPLEPDWLPGRRAGYHLASLSFLLGELVRRLDGRPLEIYAREDIFLPCGMTDSYLALSPDLYERYGPRVGVLHDTSAAAPRPRPWDTPQFASLCKPGASGRGPIRQLGRFYEMLLRGGRAGDASILRPQTVEAMTARHRTGMLDETFKHVLDWGLGFMVNSSLYGPDLPYSFGPHASPRAFGHGGAQSSMGFADPEHDLAVAFLFNGTPGEPRHQRRNLALATAIYEDLGLA